MAPGAFHRDSELITPGLTRRDRLAIAVASTRPDQRAIAADYVGFDHVRIAPGDVALYHSRIAPGATGADSRAIAPGSTGPESDATGSASRTAGLPLVPDPPADDDSAASNRMIASIGADRIQNGKSTVITHISSKKPFGRCDDFARSSRCALSAETPLVRGTPSDAELAGTQLRMRELRACLGGVRPLCAARLASDADR